MKYTPSLIFSVDAVFNSHVNLKIKKCNAETESIEAGWKGTEYII